MQYVSSRIALLFLQKNTVLEFLNNLCGLELSKNRIVAPSSQATWAGGIDSLELILGLLKSLKIRALYKT